jgi:K+ transporter
VLVLLGSIVPCATGAKALDVDTDHLGIQPVRIG